MIFDCFSILNELDLLEIRLNSLFPYIDRFFLCESPYTYSGKRKPLFYAENKDRFSQFKIEYILFDGDITVDEPGQTTEWKREHSQRELLVSEVLKHASDEDWIISSDMDEIPNMEEWTGTAGSFSMRVYNYYLNVRSWRRYQRCSPIDQKKNITSAAQLMAKRRFPPIVGGGWHFTCVGSPEDVVYKLDAGCHVLQGVDSVKDQIVSNYKNLIEPYHGIWSGRYRPQKLRVRMPTGPKWLLENQDRYKHLFYAGT